MSMDGLRDSTIQWYVEWLEDCRPDLSDVQRYEMATGFTDAQCTPPAAAAEDITDEDVVDLLDATERANMRKRERLTGQELDKILNMQPPQPPQPSPKTDARPRRLSDYGKS